MTGFLVAYGSAIGVLRVAFFGAAAVLAVVCALDWAVRTRRISPFSGVARFMRSTVDPLIAPVERRVVRHGGVPQAAPWWALGAVVVGGILVITLLEFLGDQLLFAAGATSAGPRGLYALAVRWGIALLQIALIVRVIGTWVGGTRYTPWTRWSYVLTDWFLEPLRRVLPTIGMIDFSPIVAYFGLGLLQSLLLALW